MVAWKQHCITREQSLWTAYEDALNKITFYLFLQRCLYSVASFYPSESSYGITAPVISESVQNYFNDNFWHCKIICLAGITLIQRCLIRQPCQISLLAQIVFLIGCLSSWTTWVLLILGLILFAKLITPPFIVFGNVLKVSALNLRYFTKNSSQF